MRYRGPIDGTEGVRRLIASGEEKANEAASLVPLRRLGKVEDVGALFLASPLASYISGTMIPCDGGGALDSVRPALEEAGRALVKRNGLEKSQ
jgi:NAD(P)-dependent dehydrogenase (short-subunit alcohol dehydrogenase family)